MRANNVLGIIHAQSYNSAIRELTATRTTASIPFGCRYRLIDFPLSNMVNAGITQVGIITNNNYQSLMDHVGSGKPWDLARKREGMFILPPYNTFAAASGKHSSKTTSLYSIFDFLKKSRHEYVIMTDSNAVYNIDFNDIFKFHTKMEADITVVYKHGRVPNIKDTMMFALDENKRITEVSVAQSSDVGREANFSFNIFVLRKSLLEYLVRTAIAHNTSSFEKDIIQANIENLKIYGYKAPGFAEIIDSLKTYYKTNMALLEPNNRKALFDPKMPIATKICDNVPATYGLNANVSNSLIADGCIIKGTVENSLIFRDVKIEEGAIVKNCIIMQGTTIQKGCKLNCVVTDKDTNITANKSLSGDISYPVYISKGITV
ncbi:MAG: glucose-1-phosphate adenylyltransferase subunit GlgD [Oscillospiraceae bacterium]|nr:glucose-1-phosphate adenylyltransferase subunit GlgD [Oscillospiraceae bacterium]